MLNILLSEIRKTSSVEHTFYWILPAVILCALMGFYFSGVPVLVEFVCPRENWEWGILENLQLGIIFSMLLLSVYASFKKKLAIQKWGFGFIAAFAIFIFLEEIDYGAHFTHLVGGEMENLLNQNIPRNIHNVGNNAKIFKRSVILLMAVIFVVAPFMKYKVKNQYIRYLIPNPRIIMVAALTIMSDLIPRFIVHFNILEDGGLGVNVNEFGELMVYYAFLIYLVQLVFENQLNIENAKP